MDITAQTKLIAEKASELNALICALPRTCKIEVEVTESQSMLTKFPTPRVNVTVLQWIGGNRCG